MVKKTILPKVTKDIPVISTSYSFYGGRATVELDSLGNYEILVNGKKDTGMENSAKRAPKYKQSINFVSQRMAAEYKKKDEEFVGLHKLIPKIQTLTDQQKNIDSLTIKKYERESFTLPRPTLAGIRKELKEEAEIKFADLYDDKAAEKKNFIDKNESEAFRQRLIAYEEAQNFFNEIQREKEEKANREYKKKYEKDKSEIEDYIEGEESITEQRLQKILDNIQLPYGADITCIYNKKESHLKTEIKLLESINFPTRKAKILTSGKISVKDKIVKEMTQFKTNAILSLAYYVASALFNASINIKDQRVTLLLPDGKTGYLQVTFKRDKLSSQNLKTLDLINDYCDCQRIDKLKTLRGAIQLEPISAAFFRR